MDATSQPAMNFLETWWNARERIFSGISERCWSSTRLGSAFADSPVMVRFPAPPPCSKAARAAFSQSSVIATSVLRRAFVHSWSIPSASTQKDHKFQSRTEPSHAKKPRPPASYAAPSVRARPAARCRSGNHEALARENGEGRFRCSLPIRVSPRIWPGRSLAIVEGGRAPLEAVRARRSRPRPVLSGHLVRLWKWGSEEPIDCSPLVPERRGGRTHRGAVQPLAHAPRRQGRRGGPARGGVLAQMRCGGWGRPSAVRPWRSVLLRRGASA